MPGGAPSARRSVVERIGACREGDWVAVVVRTHYERVATGQLVRHGYETFLPVRATRRSGGRASQVPLFPGYLFCRYARGNPYRILHASGVIRILGVDRGPACVPEAEVEAIRRIVSSGVDAEPCDMLRIGQRVRVIAGPLIGLCGILLAARGGQRVVVSVSILSRAVAAEVTMDQLEPIAAPAAA